MYELVNTSVPNGLIAGSHGFATVAMTKGMPDAIRSRVESLCAYPHRSSAHDQTYYAENPINWFHLLLPGGDHVVGRTAPAEFDYTGRTNRISRTLHFSSREMPINGGAYVLIAEANRFCQNWVGDPKYLPEDKSLAGRIQMAVRPNDLPRNWVNMFGSDGELYAKKFAALLTRNLRTNKCIYFKAGESDVNGERLLGLFSDLINLLPEELAAQVTFSTFSACVPNGAVCHLRGIFDKDRAFEIASALQPWIDCEGCCVKHPELLPNDIPTVIVGDDQILGSAKAGSHAIRPDLRAQHSESNYQQRQSQMVDYWNRRTEETKKNRIPWGTITCMFFCAILLGCLFLGNDIRKLFRSSTEQIVSKDQAMQASGVETTESQNNASREREMRENERKLAQWVSRQKTIIGAMRDDLRKCTDSKSVAVLIARAMEYKRDLKSVLESYGCKDYREKLCDIEIQYSSLISELEDAKKTKTNSEAKMNREAEKLIAKQSSECEKKRVYNALVDKPLKELTITEVIPPSQSWVNRLKEDEKLKLTNSADVIFWYWNGKEVHRENVAFSITEKWKDVARKNLGRIKIPNQPTDPKENPSRWLVVYIPGCQKVFWQWKFKDRVRLFEKDDVVKLSDIVFGGENDGTRLYQSRQTLIYVLSWSTTEGRFRHFCSQNEIKVDKYKPDQKKVDKNIKQLDEIIADKSNALTNRKNQLNELPDSLDKMQTALSEYGRLKNERRKADKKNDKDKKKSIDCSIRENEKKAVAEFCRYPQFKSRIKENQKEEYVDLKLIGRDEINEAVEKMKENILEDIERLKKSISQTEIQREELERAKSNWLGLVREYAFSIDVVIGEDLPEELPSNVKSKFMNRHLIDYIMTPSGVGGGN